MSNIRMSKVRLIWLGICVLVCAMAIGADAQDSQRGAVEHFIGTMIRSAARRSSGIHPSAGDWPPSCSGEDRAPTANA